VDQELLAVGIVVKAFGIRGEVVVQPLTDLPDRFGKLRTLRLGRSPGETRKMKVARVAVENRGVRLQLAGIADRTAAEAIVGEYLFVEPSQRIPLPEGRYYVHQVIGLAVVTETGEEAGHVTDVLKLAGHDVYVVEHHGREYMIPGVKEFVLAIEPDEGRMRVHLIDGMKDV
jgi:16S rRNA processing protein RimM